MDQKKIIFKNSQTNINEGSFLGEGILYCGKKYTNPNGCECGTCDGYCGPDNGCACPDCEYTLAYILYATNKMKCEKCKNNLIRIKLCNLLLLLSSDNKEIKFIICKKCKKQCKYNFIQVLHCFKCNYSICSKCSFSNISMMNNINKKKNDIFDYNKCEFSPMNLGTIYCGKKYVKEGYCLCKNCDGNCGPDNGCPCSMCSAVLGYNINLYNNKNQFLKCVNDGNLLIKSNNIEYSIIKQKNNKKNNINNDKIKSFLCNKCNLIKRYDSYAIVYYCSKCFYCICQYCIYLEIRDIEFICPEEPIIISWNNLITNEKLYSYENIEKLIINEYLNNKKKLNSVKNEVNLFIPKKRERPQNTKNINLYLKTMNGKIFTINIDNGETIKSLKNEINKMDKNLNSDKINLLYKKQMLKNFNFICDYDLEDNSIILIIKF